MIGVTPVPASTRAATSTKLSPRKRGSRPTSTRCGSGCVFTKAAIPATASRILATVNSSATIARHPEVPNLITFFIVSLRAGYAGPYFILLSSSLTGNPPLHRTTLI